MNLTYRLLPLLMGGFLVSCSLLPAPEDTPDRFLLDALSSQIGKNVRKKQALIIDQPTIYTPLDNTRVAIMPTEHTLDYIADIEWGDRLGALVHESLIHSFQNAGAFASVGRLNSGVQGERLLAIDVRKFYQRCCDHKAEVEYFVQVFDTKDRKPLASKRFHHAFPLPDKKAITVALVLNDAHQKAMEDMLEWLLTLT